MSDKKLPTTSSNAFLGIVLLALGVLFLLFNVLGRSSGPLIVAAIGVGLFGLMVMLGKRGGWLAVPASVVTMVGVLLVYTNLFVNHAQSWAYSWTLLFGAAGMGILISHYWSGRPVDTRFGTMLVRASLVAFVTLGLFFEVLIFSQGTLFGRLVWPVVLIMIGAFLFLRGRVGGTDVQPRLVGSKEKATEVAFEPLNVGGEEESPVGMEQDR